MIRNILVIIISMLIAVGAFADAFTTGTDIGGGCRYYTLCSVEADTGVCKNAGGTDEIVARVKNISNLLFHHDLSSGTWSCDIYNNSAGYDATSGTADKINSSPLTQANLAPASDAGLSGYFWAYCTISTTVHLTMTACPMSQ